MKRDLKKHKESKIFVEITKSLESLQRRKKRVVLAKEKAYTWNIHFFSKEVLS